MAFLPPCAAGCCFAPGWRQRVTGWSPSGAPWSRSALIAAAVGPAGFWPVTTMVVLGVLALGAFGYGVWRPARALRDTEAAARRAGGLLPELASDILSSVQLTAASTAPGPSQVSPALIGALIQQVTGALSPLDPRKLVSMRPAVRAIALAALAGAVLVGAALWSPTLSRGLHTLGAPAVAVRRCGGLDGAAGRRRAHHLQLSRVHRPSPAVGRGVDGRCGRGQRNTRSHRDTPAADRAPGAAAARGDRGKGRNRRRRCRGGGAGRGADADGRRELPLLAAAAFRACRARGPQPPPDRGARRGAAGRDLRSRRSAGAADAAPDRDRVHRQRRLRPGRRRSGLPGGRPPRTAR